MKKIDVLGVKFDNVDMQEAIEKCKEFISGPNSNLIVTPNPEIVMSAKENEDAVLITVTDNGCGIPAEHLPKVKEKFYKANKSQKIQRSGL